MSVQTKRIAAFLQLAEEELTAAELLVEKAPRQAAYLCQLAGPRFGREGVDPGDRFRRPSRGS